jgi:hypothetical protein
MSSSLVSMLEVQRVGIARTFDMAEALSAESMTSVSGVSGPPYGACVTWTRTYSDEQLVNAIATSSSWRGLLRELGLVATSAGAMRSVRSHADRLGVNYSHFKGQRRWSEDDLRTAIEAAKTWSEAAELLGIDDVSAESTLKGHAARLGLDFKHLTARPTATRSREIRPDIAHLDRAGSLLAASWFTLCGHDVSWPLEPSRYDLLVRTDTGIRRVQVKTTTVRAGDTWKVYLSTSRHQRRTYDPDEIDDFFIIDGELNCYLIPVAAVGGLHAIHLGGYAQYQLAQVKSGGRA